MPRGKLVRKEDPLIERLTVQLKDEWESVSSQSAEPVIIEQGSAGYGATLAIHLYIIWSEWSPLSQQERSEVILNAYKAVKGAENAAYVTVVMGLTPAEASRMGIEYEVLAPAVA